MCDVSKAFPGEQNGNDNQYVSMETGNPVRQVNQVTVVI